ncbi:MAG: hypothetical protein WD991_02675 [Candidatus Paceibacterota bacterium]
MNKKPWLAALLNFFFWGLGTMYVGKRMAVGVIMFLASLWATYVENVLVGMDSDLFGPLFVTFFVVGVAMAWDGYKEAQSTRG